MPDIMTALTELKDWALSDAGAFAGLLSVVLALLVLRETVKLRRIETDPEITVYLETRADSSWLIELIVKNVGHGQAFDVRFEVAPDKPFWQDWKLKSMTMFSQGLKHMAPGQEIRVLVGTYMEIAKEPYTVDVTYLGRERRFGKALKFSDSYVIDVRQFEGQFEIGGDTSEDMVRALKKIAAATTSISRDIKRLVAEQTPRSNSANTD